jgi:elongation factor Ts
MPGSNGSPISPSQIQELREATGAGIMDCKKALEESSGNMEKAKAWLRDRGVAIAAKKGGRMAKEGLIGSYIHAGGKLGVLVELNSETDFVARTPDFQELLKEICMQVAAAQPRWVSRDLVPPEILEEKRKEFEVEAKKDKKPDAVAAKIAEGKLEKYLAENCLLEQIYIREPSGKIKVKDLLTEAVSKMGENVVVRRFARFQVGGE